MPQGQGAPREHQGRLWNCCVGAGAAELSPAELPVPSGELGPAAAPLEENLQGHFEG